MNTPTFDVNKLRVASPCPVGWDTMYGDDRKRHCDLCELSVYNLAELTLTEVEQLVGTSGGRICMRLYRRSDGTVITKDCPVGLRAVRRRVARFASATLAAILGLFSITYSQSDTKKDRRVIPASELTIARDGNPDKGSVLTGTLLDAAGAVVAGVNVTIASQDRKSKSVTIQSDDVGNYRFTQLFPGTYVLKVKASGFSKLEIKELRINQDEIARVNLTLLADADTVTLGIVGESVLGNVITTATIENLPLTEPIPRLKFPLLPPKKP